MTWTYIELRTVVNTVQDLVQLTEMAAREDVSGHEIRRSTPQLRQLLVNERLILKAWRLLQLPESPMIETNTISIQRPLSVHGPVKLPTHTNYPGDELVGLVPAVRGGEPITRCLSPAAFMSGDTAISVRQSVKIAEFLDSAGLMVYGIPISRKAAIQFLCHKRGGAHLDAKIVGRDIDNAFDVIQITHDPTPYDLPDGTTMDLEFRLHQLSELEMYIFNTIKDLVDTHDIRKLIGKGSEVCGSQIAVEEGPVRASATR